MPISIPSSHGLDLESKGHGLVACDGGTVVVLGVKTGKKWIPSPLEENLMPFGPIWIGNACTAPLANLALLT